MMLLSPRKISKDLKARNEKANGRTKRYYKVINFSGTQTRVPVPRHFQLLYICLPLSIDSYSAH